MCYTMYPLRYGLCLCNYRNTKQSKTLREALMVLLHFSVVDKAQQSANRYINLGA